MEIVLILAALTVIAIAISSRSNKAPSDIPLQDAAPPEAAPATDTDAEVKEENPLQKKADELETAIRKCEADHPDAMAVLSWLAASDGSVSQQELRIMFRFCDSQGTRINKSVIRTIELLNSGIHMQVMHDEAVAHQHIGALAARPIEYRLAFFGAAHALCGSHKTVSQKKQDILDRAMKIVMPA